MSIQLDPATFARAIIVESADIPDGMTIAEWRRQRSAQAPRANRRKQAAEPFGRGDGDQAQAHRSVRVASGEKLVTGHVVQSDG